MPTCLSSRTRSDTICTDLLQWVQREAMGDGPGSEATRLLDELMALPGIAAAARARNLDRRALPFLPVIFRKEGVELNLFTTITPLGTPQDVTVHELRLESVFRADAGSRQWFLSAWRAPFLRFDRSPVRYA